MPMPSNGAEITLLKGCAIVTVAGIALALLLGGLLAKAVF